MLDSRRMEQIIGETMREIGTLMFVFAPLDAAIAGIQQAAAGLRVLTLVATVLIVFGIMIESQD